MVKNNRTKEWLILGAILLLFIIDRVIKFSIAERESTVINKFSALDLPISNEIIVVITLFVMLWLVKEVFGLYREKKFLLGMFFVGIIAGGLSNLVDRLYYNGVIDYIKLFDWFPIFNIADLLITLSVVGVGLYLYFESHEKHN